MRTEQIIPMTPRPPAETPKHKSWIGEKLSALLGGVRKEELRREQTAAEAYEALVVQLADIDSKGRGKTPTAAEILAVIEAAKKTAIDLEKDVANKKQIAELLAIVATREVVFARRAEVTQDRKNAEQRFEQQRLEYVALIDQLHAKAIDADVAVQNWEESDRKLSNLLVGEREREIAVERVGLAKRLHTLLASPDVAALDGKSYEQQTAVVRLREVEDLLRSMPRQSDADISTGPRIYGLEQERERLTIDVARIKRRYERAVEAEAIQTQIDALNAEAADIAAARRAGALAGAAK